MKRLLIVIFVGFAAASSSVRAESCRADSVTGLFDGGAHSEGIGDVDVTLNLYCDGKSYAGQIFTSIGDLPVSAASSSGSAVHVAFDTGASLGTFDLTLAGQILSGTFDVAGDKGTLTLTRKGPALARDAMRGRLDLSAAQWQEDIEALGAELPKRHANAFFYLSRQAFEAEIARLRTDTPSLDGDQIFVRLAQIVNSIGDGHTGLVSPPDRRDLPIEINQFGQDLRITSAAHPLERALGARVLAIDGMEIARARTLALTLTPSQELPELREGRIVFYLARGLTLHGLGIAQSREHARFTLASDAGERFDIDVPGQPPSESPALVSAIPHDGLRFQKADEPFWCQALEDKHAVYCAFHAYQELEAKAKAMFALIDEIRASKLILDMRDNGGGDNTIGDAALVKPLKARTDLNRKGHLFVLIGPLTFSAAMNNAAQFQDETNAILVGQTIGEKPNSYQEPRQFRLPNSHLIVRASTRYYEFRKHGENAVRPDKEIIPTWEEMKAGRDPALDWALAQ